MAISMNIETESIEKKLFSINIFTFKKAVNTVERIKYLDAGGYKNEENHTHSIQGLLEKEKTFIIKYDNMKKCMKPVQ